MSIHPATAKSRLAAFTLFACLAAGGYGQRQRAVHALAYDAQTRGPVPIPPSERGLQTVVAEPWFNVSHQGIVLEGAAFEGNGNLLFCDVSGRRVLRLTHQKNLSTVIRLDDSVQEAWPFRKMDVSSSPP